MVEKAQNELFIQTCHGHFYADYNNQDYPEKHYNLYVKTSTLERHELYSYIYVMQYLYIFETVLTKVANLVNKDPINSQELRTSSYKY